MNKTLPLCLFAVSLLLGVVAAVMFLSSGARAQGDGIIVDGADYESVIANEHSADLANATTEVTTRVVEEYGDFGFGLELNGSSELDQAASAVSSRAAVEYADFASNYASQSSDVLQEAAVTVTSRIVVEYADCVIPLAISPYLGPQQYPGDNILPNITVAREPSGLEVSDSQDVLVSANITDAESGVRNATLRYTIDNSTDWYGANAHTVPMSLNLTLQPQDSSALSFNATIWGQASGIRVRFSIIAYDFAGNNATIDGVTDTATFLVVPEFPSTALLSLFAMATLCAAIVYRRKHPAV